MKYTSSTHHATDACGIIVSAQRIMPGQISARISQLLFVDDCNGCRQARFGEAPDRQPPCPACQ